MINQKMKMATVLWQLQVHKHPIVEMMGGAEVYLYRTGTSSLYY
jgi:hypothetical protein